jgi:YD repeat-containing protein
VDTELRGSPAALQQSCEYQDSNGLSVRHGPFFEWHPNGRKKSEGHFVHGKQEGEWTSWDQDGNVIAERDYRDGQVVADRTR